MKSIKRIILIILFFGQIFSSEKNCKFNWPDLGGSAPSKLYQLIQHINKSEEAESSKLLNRLILHGPSGNGKTCYAKKFAKEINATLISINSASIIAPLQGSTNIEKVFEISLEEYKKENKKIVIFFDNADAFSHNSSEYSSATQTLCFNLDNIINNSDFFVILALNDLHNIHSNLINRFGDNIIKIPNPDTQMRKEVTEFYLNKFSINFSDKIKNLLIEQTENFNIRSIENILKSIKLYDPQNFTSKNQIVSYINEFQKKHNKDCPSNASLSFSEKLSFCLQNLNFVLNIIPSLTSNYLILSVIYKSYISKNSTNTTAKETRFPSIFF